jgi:solute carrier family 35 protein F5
MVGVETLTRTKFLAVLARSVVGCLYTRNVKLIYSFVGVVMVTRSDSTLSTSLIDPSSDLGLPTHPVLGDLAAILSACFYAIYVILLKKQVGDEDRADMQLMLG